MLRFAILFAILALISGALGFFGLEGSMMQIAKVLFLLFVILFIVSLVVGRNVAPTI